MQKEYDEIEEKGVRCWANRDKGASDEGVGGTSEMDDKRF
jgi:hypothetical protein